MLKEKNPYSFAMRVPCGEEQHTVLFKDGKLQFPDHGSSFRRFKLVYQLSGGSNDCGCMTAAIAWRRIIAQHQLRMGRFSHMGEFIRSAKAVGGSLAAVRLASQWNYAYTDRRLQFRDMVAPQPGSSMPKLEEKLYLQRFKRLDESVRKINNSALKWSPTREIVLGKCSVSKDKAQEIFSAPNLRGRHISFAISLPSWASMVREFGVSNLSILVSDRDALVIHARFMGIQDSATLVTRFWALAYTPAGTTHQIVWYDRFTTVDPVAGLSSTWSARLGALPLNAKTLSKVYENV